MSDVPETQDHAKGFLGFVERAGNKLPDPVFIFLFLLVVLVIISVIASLTGLTATLSDQVLGGMSDANKARFAIGADGVIPAISLLSPDNIQRLWTEMPATFTHFHPLGYVLVVMLGAGVAERTGLFGDAMRAAVRGAPKFLLTPVVAFVAMAGNHAADAAYVVLIPLAGILFASAGRHPIAGIAAAFAGVSGGFSANFAPGQLDALLYGITLEAAEILVPDYQVNIAGNWYFIAAMMVIFVPVIWFVTDKIIEPKLGAWEGVDGSTEDDADKPLNDDQKKGLMWAGIAVLGVFALWTFFVIGPGTPLYITDAEYIAQGLTADEAAAKEWFERCGPLFNSLVAAFLVLFLAAGVAYGVCAKTIKSGDDLVGMMADGMKDMGYYLVLAFAAAHFVAMFGWSNLGLISAVHGAAAIESANLHPALILGLIVLFTGFINLFVGSASAKWALLAPVMVPMLMLAGISPDASTAAYRVGDSATNIITPLMVYFPLILIFAQRWKKDFGIGSLTAIMIPYSIWILISGLALMIVWVALGIDLGPGAPVGYELPTTGG
ncbi:AbgT family transporter [Ponticaulis sp.]|uniref:AbgT family transporter n=1 Tax=Ponticaulis sp. TaxID=2020902 RepID=UPI00260B9694|nr:AbgT family transporter [Ponticaulis sp.]MDF1679138.1 AbgT family transporter [Ponticaulis sp.]